MDTKKTLEDEVLKDIVIYSTEPTKLRPILEHAIKMGLHNEDRDVSYPEPGVKYNIKEYVRYRCQRLGIEIPEEK